MLSIWFSLEISLLAKGQLLHRRQNYRQLKTESTCISRRLIKPCPND